MPAATHHCVFTTEASSANRNAFAIPSVHIRIRARCEINHDNVFSQRSRSIIVTTRQEDGRRGLAVECVTRRLAAVFQRNSLTFGETKRNIQKMNHAKEEVRNLFKPLHFTSRLHFIAVYQNVLEHEECVCVPQAGRVV